MASTNTNAVSSSQSQLQSQSAAKSHIISQQQSGSAMIRDHTELMSTYDPRSNKTSKILTRYERANLLGLRTEQIARGAKPLLEDSEFSFDELSPADLALEELRQKRTPYIVVRNLPDGSREYWKVKDMVVML